MFASFLPSTSSKLAQNGPSKPSSNRFSVRVFKTQSNVPFPYPVAPKVEPGYRSNSQREQPNSNWYQPSTAYPTYDQRPRVATNYSIYPSANNGTFIYEQSACSKSDIFSNSELDSPTTDDFSPASVFSPAMSTDSTITLPRTTIGDPSVEDLRLTRTVTPAPRSAYPPPVAPSQAAMMARTTSTGRPVHEAAEDQRSRVAMLQARSTTPATPMRLSTPGTNQADPMLQMVPPYISVPEYAGSTFSEVEVNKRDLIAKRNAELNSTPTASFYSSSAGSASSDNDRRRVPSTGQPSPSTRDVRSVPPQPGLNFPTRPLESEYKQSGVVPPAPFPMSRENSPPRVERLPSNPAPDAAPSQVGSQSTYSYASLATENWSRDATLDSRPPSRSSQAIYTTAAQQDLPLFSRQDRAAPAPMERTRSRRISIAGPRPDLNASRPLSEFKDYGPASRAGSDPGPAPAIYSDRRDLANSLPRGDLASPRDAASRAASGTEYRRDSRTPSPREGASRRDSYAVDPARAFQDPRSKPQSPNDPREYIKSAPLSSSPTELEAASSRYPSQRPYLAPPGAPTDRVRTRSSSFSTSTRPTPTIAIPFNGAMPLPPPPPYSGVSESRNTGDYDRSRGERSSPSARPTPPAEFDRRGTPASQGIYYSQPEYQNQAAQRPAAALSMSSSRAMDRTSSTVQVSSSRAAPSDPTRARTFPDPTYGLPPPHEPVRRYSDGENPYDRAGSLSRSYPAPGLKVMNPAPSPPPMHPVEPIPLPATEPHRRNSDGDQTPPLRLPLGGRSSAPLLRSVRWNENLVCPSPIPTYQRRKGWFNRRGDQLWTNDGAYKAAPSGQEYPPDLEEYPECGEGWMNEECIRIDLTHRLIPKPPLRSALKQARN
ncbi:hypothetical protein HYPSUDRAFT_47096 [Hypholoma sublateritium FD-334 SS-4]|uniref:Uncharacterized protein n=1 Tax=Hypholoma sublateritium (strain FD-334 SS-4) TaxID=945553 RepID=A0A0D2NC88_HYPSF|nr:hypothetical protein HYPSUDRAFT_47096 [Hypholoma sublateritium FD-334 SS-4]